MLCRLFLYSVPQLQEHWGTPESTAQSAWKAHRFAFSLFGSFSELLEGLVWLFRIAESLSYDFQTILHFADVLRCLMPVECVGGPAGSWNIIQGSTCNYEIEVNTNTLMWMLYWVYAVVGGCWTWCILYLVWTYNHCMESYREMT
jgi:hypothetical protein